MEVIKLRKQNFKIKTPIRPTGSPRPNPMI